MKWGHPLYYSLRSLGVRNNLGISMLINLIFLPIPINLILFSHPKSSTTVSSDVIPRKFCFSLKASQEIGRPSGHSNRGQRRHVHIWRHVVVRKGKRETVKKREREKGRVDDVVGWDKLAAVSFETAPRGPLRRVTPHGRRKVIPTYLPIPRLHFRRRNKGRRHGRHPSPRPNASCFSPFLGVRARDHRFLSSRLLSRFSLSLSRVFFLFLGFSLA